MPLPPSVYAHSLTPGLADLRLVDAQGQRVPHAWLPQPTAGSAPEESLRSTTAYPLPHRAGADQALTSPVEVIVQGDRLQVRALGQRSDAASQTGSTAVSPGWLFDLGEPAQGVSPPQRLRLAWSGPAEFTASVDLETSTNLQDWRPAGSGQLMALNSASGRLTQRDLSLPADVSRFVRLVWRDAASAPAVSGAQAVHLRPPAHPAPSTETLSFSPSPEPAGRQPAPPSALHFDLGAVLPIQSVDLQLPPGTRVAPLRVQGRQRADESWRDIGSWVAYHLERADGQGSPGRSPPLALQANVRYLRLLPDERSGALDPTSTRLDVQAALATLVFAHQGQPPFQLQAGATGVADGALPIATLVPGLTQELPRLGRAQLGAWAEVAAVAAQADAAQRQAERRIWWLWSVLIAGVVGLGAMVWKLMRGRHDPAPPAGH